MILEPTSGEYAKLFGVIDSRNMAYRCDVLPRVSIIDSLKKNRCLFHIDGGTILPVGLPDTSKLYKLEKSSNVDRIGIPVKQDNETVYFSFYFKPYNSLLHLYDKLVSSSALLMYPVPIEPYGVLFNGMFGLATLDLTSLRDQDTKQPIHSIRYDVLLNKLGLHNDTLTFFDLQNFIYNSELNKIMDRTAIVQCALGTHFLANAFGEVDPNSRNLLFLENPSAESMDPSHAKNIFGESENPPKKLGFAVRIDVDEITYDNAKNKIRSGKRLMGRSILFSNESADKPLPMSPDDIELLLEYSKNPNFVLEGSFIPPKGMSEAEFISQIADERQRIKSIKEKYKSMLKSKMPNADNHTIDLEVERLMIVNGDHAMKKSYYELINEQNPNIDWTLFSDLLRIANNCISETIVSFAVESNYMKHMPNTTNDFLTRSPVADYDEYMLFKENILARANDYIKTAGRNFHINPNDNHIIGTFSKTKSSQKVSFEQMPINERKLYHSQNKQPCAE